MFIKSKRVFINNKLRPATLSIHSGRISSIHPYSFSAPSVFDAGSWMVLPGAVDAHVHMREPEAPQKEDFFSGSSAALFGGVTSYLDMPCYRSPPTTTVGALTEKERLAGAKSVADFGFHFGASNENTDLVRRFSPPSIKAFMSDTNSPLSLTPSGLERHFSSYDAAKPLCVHCEDRALIEQRTARFSTHGEIRSSAVALSAVKRASELGRRYHRRVHFCHLTTSDEVKQAKLGAGHLKPAPGEKTGQPLHTVEVSAHHLFLSVADLGRLKGCGIVNPPLRERPAVASLWRNLRLVDCVASDHAPHLLADKEAGAAGFPGVQTTVPLLLHAVVGGKLKLEEAVRLFSSGPADAFNLQRKGRIAPNYDADLFLFDPTSHWMVQSSDLRSKAGWSPYEGWRLRGRVMGVFLRGEQVVWEGELGVKAGFGKPIQRAMQVGVERLDLRKHAKERFDISR